MITPRFEIRKSRVSGEHYFVLIGRNGKIIARGTYHRSKPACRRAITAVTEAVGGYSVELAIVDTTEARA